MVDMVGDIPGVEVYMNDVLVHAPTQELHDSRLQQVLAKFQKDGLKLNLEKCRFSQNSVQFLGHTVSETGIKPSPVKVKAIQDAVVPCNKAEVRSLLGLVTYLSKFCPRLSDVTKPLRELTNKNVEFHWEAAQQEAFENVKKLVSNAPVLAHFDPTQEVVVNVDASSHSLGAVLMQNGRPIEFAAQSLTPTQALCAQIEKEMLAIQFGLTHFHQYVYGRTVKVESDHMPLVRVSKKPLCELTPRLQRMKMRIQHYDIEVVHVPGRHMYLSDYLSRSCAVNSVVEDLSFEDPLPEICAVIIRSSNDVSEYTEATAQDGSLQKVLRYTKLGWPKHKRHCHPLAKPFWIVRDMLSELHRWLAVLWRKARRPIF